MRLFTVQPKEVYDQILHTGMYTCIPDKSEYISNSGENFVEAYKWLIKQMNEKIENKERITYPVWAWYKLDGKNELPDFNNTLISYANDYLIEIEINKKDVVLTDYDSWHFVLNNSYYNPYEDEKEWEEEEYRYEMLPYEEANKLKLASWQRVFDVENDKYVQATFWQLKKENIVSVHKILKSVDLDDIIYMIEDKDYTDKDRADAGYSKETLPNFLNNYYLNAKNRYEYLLSLDGNENLDNLIKKSTFKLPQEQEEKIQKIIKFFDLNEKDIIR